MITNYFDIQCANRHAKPSGRWGGMWPDNPELSLHCKPLEFEDRKILLSIDEFRSEQPLKWFQLEMAEEMSKKAFDKDLFIDEIPIKLRRK